MCRKRKAKAHEAFLVQTVARMSKRITPTETVSGGDKCDRACENRACGLKYAMLFDSTYLNTEM